MTLLQFSSNVAWLALAFSLLAFGQQLRALRRLPRPLDRTLPRGNPVSGVRYAFTWGMMPWAKESTRRHWGAYLRGIGFHLGVFLALAGIVAGPWLDLLPFTLRAGLAAVLGVSALLCLGGLFARLYQPNLRALSKPDDYFAVGFVGLFLACAAAALFSLALLPLFYWVGAALLVYAPFGKIRHCVYYPYSRLFFGRNFGRRGVLPPGHALKVLR